MWYLLTLLKCPMVYDVVLMTYCGGYSQKITDNAEIFCKIY